MGFLNKKMLDMFSDRSVTKRPKTYGSSSSIEKKAYREANKQGNLEYLAKRSNKWYPKKRNTKILKQSIYRIKLNKNPRNL